MSDVTPIHLRELKAAMALKGLSLEDVSKRAAVPYSICSQILNGRYLQAETKIRAAIKNAPMPKEAAAA